MTYEETSQADFDLPNKRKCVAVAVAAALSASTVLPVIAEAQQFEEIVVTATRREQSIQDVPYNITAVSGEAIENAGATDLASLMRIIPGVVYADMGPRGNSHNSSIVLRGLNVTPQANGAPFAGVAVAPVSMYVDETPMFANLRLIDIERVEVLRGPQGTLYGSGSLAGTIRFIHHRPDTESTSGSISAGVEFLGQSDEQSYNVEGILNLPLSDNFAVRLAGSYEDTGGVIDANGIIQLDSSREPVLSDPNDFIGSPPATQSKADIDTSKALTVRGSLLWDITDSASALLTYHHQNIEASGDRLGAPNVDSYTGIYPFINQFDQDIDLVSLEVEADLGFATITSSTSYDENKIDTQRELTALVPFLDAIVGPCFIYGCYPRGPFDANEPASKENFAQEFRLTSNSSGSIDWVAGVFYSDQKAELLLDQVVRGYANWANTVGTDQFVNEALGGVGSVGLSFYDYFLAGSISNPADVPNQFFFDRKTDFQDLAVFGEVTFNISDAWQITGGVRRFEQDLDVDFLQIFTNCGVFCSTTPNDPVLGPLGITDVQVSESLSDQIFKFNTSYGLNEDHKVYFNWAEGFRHGGVNPLPVGAFGITADLVPYEADKTSNFEIGVKGSLADGRINYTLAGFFIDWDKPQIDAFVSGAALPAVVNGVKAESQGIELELNGQVTDNFSFAFGYNYTDAELTEDFDVSGVTGVKGSPLPGIAEHQANLALDYFQTVGSNFGLHYHLDGVYKSDALNDRLGGSNQFNLDAYSLWNGSVSLSRGGLWTVTAFVDNLFDEDQALFSANQTLGRNLGSFARPISYGLRLKYEFE